jgi:hypothetical protein
LINRCRAADFLGMSMGFLHIDMGNFDAERGILYIDLK